MSVCVCVCVCECVCVRVCGGENQSLGLRIKSEQIV